jgi:hypothetical protein
MSFSHLCLGLPISLLLCHVFSAWLPECIFIFPNSNDIWAQKIPHHKIEGGLHLLMLWKFASWVQSHYITMSITVTLHNHVSIMGSVTVLSIALYRDECVALYCSVCCLWCYLPEAGWNMPQQGTDQNEVESLCLHSVCLLMHMCCECVAGAELQWLRQQATHQETCTHECLQ